MNEDTAAMLEKARQILDNKHASDEMLKILKQQNLELRRENRHLHSVIDIMCSRIEEAGLDIEITKGRRFTLL